MERDRSQSVKEEIANSILHGIGALLSIGTLILLIIKALNTHSTAVITSYTVFGLSAFLLFLISTLHHSISHKRTKHVFLVLDYSFIYVLIAATYAPFTIAILGLSNIISLIIFTLVILLAITGITLTSIFSKKVKTIAPACYIPMGWLAIFLLKPISDRADSATVTLLIAGGVVYTIGTYFYLTDHKKYHHAIWHLAVLIAVSLHSIMFLQLKY